MILETRYRCFASKTKHAVAPTCSAVALSDFHIVGFMNLTDDLFECVAHVVRDLHALCRIRRDARALGHMSACKLKAVAHNDRSVENHPTPQLYGAYSSCSRQLFLAEKLINQHTLPSQHWVADSKFADKRHIAGEGPQTSGNLQTQLFKHWDTKMLHRAKNS